MSNNASPQGEVVKVWKVWHHDPDLGCLVFWVGSRQEARQRLKDRIASYDDPDAAQPSGIECEDIPTDQAGLLNWLNINYSTENG